jgi:hypothetical protein
MSPGQPDRYEPLPSLLELPGFIARKLSKRAKRAILAVFVLILAAIAIGVPTLIAAKHRSDAADARAEAKAHAAQVAQLRKELHLVNGHGTAARGLSGAAALTARHALVQDLSSAVDRDAMHRFHTGEITERPNGVHCFRFPVGVPGTPDPSDDLKIARGRYTCLAITTGFTAGKETTGGEIGYPYRALVNFDTGRFAFCKYSGRPGEGSLLRPLEVALPAACGGERGG